MSETRVTMAHARAARLDGKRISCAPGIRLWCERHGIDMREFRENGMSISDAERIDDAFARRAVEIARAEVGHE